MDMDKATEIQAFEEKTGVNYYKAMETNFLAMGTKLICLDEQQLETLDNDIFMQGLEKLYSLCNTTEHKHDVKRTSEHYKELTRTFIKCTSKSPKTSKHDALIMNMIDKDKIIDVLCNNNRIAYNPFMIMNDWSPPEFTSILMIDTKSANRLGYIKNVYNGRHLYKQKVIKKAYEVAEYQPIPKQYVKKVLWNMYTPYVWWLIQTEQFSKLIISTDELKKNIS